MAAHILLIEDDPDLRMMLTDALRRASYDISTASSVREAKALTDRQGARFLQRDDPVIDLVLLDLSLPDGVGSSLLEPLCRELQAPVIVISARHEDESKIRLLDEGADDYLVKPFSIGELLARVRVALRRAPRMQASQSRIYEIGRAHV